MITSFTDQNGFLSNFFFCRVKVHDIEAVTAEHAFQALKTLDNSERHQVLECSTPGQAKRMGQRITLRPDWEDIKIDVMRSVVRAKFTQNLELAAQLIRTKDVPLIEGNNWGDQFWGMTFNQHTQSWEGENHLGKILMQVRQELQSIRFN